jgi:hypothetical protein
MTFPLHLNFLENTKPFLKPPKVQICLVLAIGWLFVSGFVVIIPGLQIDRTEKKMGVHGRTAAPVRTPLCPRVIR